MNSWQISPTTLPPPQLAGRIGLSLTGLCWLILLTGVGTRALAEQRVQWGNMYELAIIGGVIVIGAYPVFVKTLVVCVVRELEVAGAAAGFR